MGILSSDFIRGLETQNGLPSGLLAGLIGQESSGNPKAVSKAGARGLTQLMPKTAQELGVTDVNDPVQNVTAGAKYLGGLIRNYGGDVEKGLQAYNWGQGNMNSYLKTGKGAKGQDMPLETQQYAGKVMGKAGLLGDPLQDMIDSVKSSQDGNRNKSQKQSSDPLQDMIDGAAKSGTKYQEAPTALERFGAGMNDVFSGIKQGASYLADKFDNGHRYADVTAQQKAANGTYEDGRAIGGQTGFDGMRMLGQIAATAPAGLAARGFQGAKILSGAGAKVLAQNAAVGATAGGVQFADNADQRLANIAAGGVGGAGGAVAGKAIGAGATKIARVVASKLNPSAAAANAAAQVDQTLAATLKTQGIDFNALNEQVKNTLRQHATDALKVTDDLNPQAVANQSALADLGIEGTKGQLLKDTMPQQWTREKNLAQMVGAGDSLRAKFAQDHRQLVSALDELVAMPKGKTGNQFDTASSLADAATAKVGAARQKINQLWNDARDSSGLEVHLDGQRFAANANQSLYDALAEGELPSGVHRILSDLMQGKAPLTVHNAQTIIQRLNALYNPAVRDPKNVAIKTVRQALENELDTALNQPKMITKANQLVDPNNPVNAIRPEDAADTIQKFRMARAASKQFFDMLDQNPALKAADSDVAPDDFFKKFILQSKQRDLINLKQTLGKEHQQAWNDARGEVLQAIRDRAVSANGSYLPNGINAAIKSIGPQRLSVLLNPDELALLSKIQKAGKIATQDPIEGGWNRSGSGAAVNDHIGLLLSGLAKLKIPSFVVSGIARNIAKSAATSEADAAASGAGAFAGTVPKGTTQSMKAAAQFHSNLADRVYRGALADSGANFMQSKNHQ